MGSKGRRAFLLSFVVAGLALGAVAPTAGAKVPVKRLWMEGFAAPDTPSHLDKVGVIEIGSPLARNVLVLEPGTSAGAGYFVPFAKWLVEKAPGWQVWSVERRENRLEDQSELKRFKAGKVTPAQFFRYYLGYLAERDEEKHFVPLNEQVAVKDGARQWGMNVAVQDLHVVIEAAKALGGKVVLGGHSLGGSVVTAYATWDFAGKPGADGLAGLVYDDGGSGPTPISATEAEAALANLNTKTPWLAFGGIPAPDLGLFGMVGASLAHFAPQEPSLFATWPFLPESLKTRNAKGEVVPSTSEAGFAYGVNVGTSPPNLAAAQVHAGAGLLEPVTPGEPWGWNPEGALTPIQRYAEMLAGVGVANADGEEWYFPERLTIDTGAVADGNANPAQAVLGEDAIHGSELPTSLHILAINSELDALLGGHFNTLEAARTLAEQSHIPAENVTLIDEEHAYAHNDPAGAYPENEFMSHLVPFLEGL